MAWKVVIVEDEDLLRNGLIHAIPWEELGFVMAGEADNGKAGLELIRETRPHVVFSDIRMAQLDGLTMAEKIHEWNPDIRIVFISGYDEFDYAMRALKVGAVEYILKPIQLDEVKETLRSLAEKLEEERKSRQEYRKLKRLEEYSIGQLRQELYRSVIYGSDTERRDKAYTDILSPEELECCYGVMIAEKKDFPILSMNADYIGIMEMDHTFEDMLTATLGDEAEYTMLRGSAGERLMVLRGENPAEVRKKISRCRESLLGAGKEAQVFQVGEGRPEHGLEGLYRSYLDARKDIEEQYWGEWTELTEETGEAKDSLNFINYDKEPLIQAVKSGNRERIEEECDRLEKELSNRKVISHMHLILIVTSIFEELVRLPEEIGRTAEDAAGKPMADYHRIISAGKRSEILAELKRYCCILGDMFGECRESRMQTSLKRAVSYMNQEYKNESLMMGDVAKYAYVSSSYLSIMLKKETGKTFIEYLTDIRIEHARKLLRETEMKNYEVAQACGFANATYFSTVFKSVCGLSPSAWRKEQEEHL